MLQEKRKYNSQSPGTRKKASECVCPLFVFLKVTKSKDKVQQREKQRKKKKDHEKMEKKDRENREKGRRVTREGKLRSTLVTWRVTRRCIMK